MKKDVSEVIQGEEAHLNNLLTTEDQSAFKGMVDELRDNDQKSNVFKQKQKQDFVYYKIIDTKSCIIGNFKNNNIFR